MLVIHHLKINVSEMSAQQAIAANTKEKFKQSLDKAFKYNTFVRSGVAGDWRNHFSTDDISVFKEIAGDLLITLGNERNLNW